MKIKLLFLLLISSIILTGCVLDPYTNKKYGSLAIDSWFNDKTLGSTRKNIENIDEIISSKCKYLENKKNKYVFSCEIVYKEKGETVIPLSKNSTIKVYAVFIKNKNSYNSKVYNSSYKNKVWLTDEYLNY